MQLSTVARIGASIVSPIAVGLGATVLDQSNLVEIPWVGGAVVVAGLVCGLLLRTPLASAYIFAIWFVGAVAAVITEDGSADPPAEAMVLILLPILVLPAAFAALIGGSASAAWAGRSITQHRRNV